MVSNRSRRNLEDLKNTNCFYNAVWGKNSSLLRRIFFSFLFAIVIAGIYLLWLIGTIRLEVELENPADNFLFQVFYADGKSSLGANTKIKKIEPGKQTISFVIIGNKINKVRIDPATARNLKLRIKKIKISNGFSCREIFFVGKKSLQSFKKVYCYSIQYLGDGYFLTTGDDPNFAFFSLEDFPVKKNYHFYPIPIIFILALSFFFLPQLLLLYKILFCKFGFVVAQLKRRSIRLFHDYPFWIYAFTILLLGWGFELFNFTLMTDDEVFFHLLNQRLVHAWLQQQRWAMSAVVFLTGNPTVPMIPLAITLFSCFLSFCILFYSPNRNEKYYLFPVYTVFPLLYHSFSFSSLNPGVGFAFLLSALSVYLVNKRSVACFLLATMLASFAIGCYEIFVFFIAIAAVFWWLQRSIRHEFYSRFKYICYFVFKYICFGAGSFLLYKTMLYFCLSLFGLKNNNHLMQNYVGLVKDFSFWYSRVSVKIWQYWSGSSDLFPKEMIFRIGERR